VTVAVVGLTVRVVTVAWMGTVTVLVTVKPPTSFTVTVSVYVPIFVKVAVLFFAALFPLGLKLTDVGPVALQVYVRAASPPSSAPSTLRLVVVPVTGLGVAFAGVAMVGGWLVPPETVTVTLFSTLPPAPVQVSV
jgi:hypothetical protein